MLNLELPYMHLDLYFCVTALFVRMRVVPCHLSLFCTQSHCTVLFYIILEQPRACSVIRTPRKVYSGFNTVFLSLLLLAAGVGFPAACFWR